MRNNPPSPLTPANRQAADSAARSVSVQELFDAALELSLESRAAYLDEACRADPDLRRGVGDLLAVLDRAHTNELFPPLADAPRGLLAFGERIGPYRVLHELGAGGMGVVFLAEREDIQKRVALKLVREGGLASGDRVRRFLLERQVLARLEHPNIARLLDAGVTELRLPYFAMEYVSGTPIDRYCDERRLPIAERLSLFRTVCEAVHHAHQNLVVHRDLKPSNILVTADGQVKLLDFGIAKLLAQHESSSEEAAHTGLLMLTPEYASPEQVRGEPVTTASDIYSLGVVLYQLLTGHRPYRFDARTPAEIERVVCRESAPRPSDVVTRTVTGTQVAATHVPLTPEWVGVARNISPERLRRRLRGDLDTMVMKALSKEPGRRYVSAAQFADDLRRHLVGLPVLARKDTASYRAGKFLRRHLVGVVAVVVLVSTLVTGVVSTAWQAQRAEAQRIVAEERFRDVHSLATTVLFEIHDAIADLPGATRARALIVDRGLDYLGRLTRQSQGDETLERESAEAYIRLGMAQGYPTGANLGDLAGARGSLVRALALASPLVAAHPEDLRSRRTLALAYEKLGDVKAWTGDVAGAVQDARSALHHWALLAESQPSSFRARLSLAISTIKLGDLLGHPSFPNLGDRPAAEAQYRRALELMETAPPDSAGQRGKTRQVGLAQERLGAMLRLEGRLDESLAAFERSLALREGLAREDGTSTEAARDVAVSREGLCEVQRLRGDLGTALRHCEAAVTLYQDLRDADRGNVQGLSDLATARSALSSVLASQGRRTAAVAELDGSTELLHEFLQANPGNLRAGRELARNLLTATLLRVQLASMAASSGRPDTLLRSAQAQYAEGRRALRESLAGAATVDDSADEALAREAADALARAPRP